jgi:hypothetical protein
VSNIFGNPTPQPPFTARGSNPTKFRNLDAGRGPIGVFTINTATLSDGLHTIAWGVADSAARGEGIGSRFFNVLNAAPFGETEASLREAPARVLGTAGMLDQYAPGTDGVWGRTPMHATADQAFAVRLPEMGRLEMWLGGPVEAGYLVTAGTLRPLPIGSSLDGAQFGWMPPVGYVGSYHLAFVRGGARIDVNVTVVEKPRVIDGEAQILMHLDPVINEYGARRVGSDLSERSVRVDGWAFDPHAAIEAGIGAVHVWATRMDDGGATPFFLGEAALNQARPELVATMKGAPSHAGFSLTSAMKPGTYTLTAYVWNARTNRWEDARSAQVVVK